MVIQDMEAAQEAVLGSLLISPELVGVVLAQVQDRDFVSPRHRISKEFINGPIARGEIIKEAERKVPMETLEPGVVALRTA